MPSPCKGREYVAISLVPSPGNRATDKLVGADGNWPNTQASTYQHTNISVSTHKHTNTQTHKHTNTQTREKGLGVEPQVLQVTAQQNGLSTLTSAERWPGAMHCPSIEGGLGSARCHPVAIHSNITSAALAAKHCFVRCSASWVLCPRLLSTASSSRKLACPGWCYRQPTKT